MANFNIISAEIVNTKPTIDNVNIKTWNRNIMPFTIANFTTDANFTDPEGDGLGKVKILTLPGQGELIYGSGNDPVTINQEFTATDISNGVLKYYCIDYHGASAGTFNFAVTDDSPTGIYSDPRMFNIDVGEISSYGSATSTNDDLYCATPDDYIISNFNVRATSTYRNLNFGVLRALDPYNTSPIYAGLPADSIVIESFEQDLIVQDSFSPWNPANVISWSGALPPQIRTRDIIDGANNVLTLPITVPLSGNTGVTNIGPRILFEVELDMYVPATINYPANSSHDFAFRRFIFGYKIYSGGVAQTRTLYFMWYTGTVS